MTFKEIDADFATKLSERKVQREHVSHKTKILNPLQKLDLQAAVKDRKEKALIQGRMFQFYYDLNNGMVFYNPVDELVPCGWLEIDRVLSGGYID